MRNLLFFGCIMLFIGCSKSVKKDDLQQLNGYWEIEQVDFPGGGTKEYKINLTVDYIKLDGMKGFRKKMQPKLDGTYETSDATEELKIVEKDGNFSMNYTTGFSEWSEELVEIGPDTFSVVNKEGKQYDYKRYEPINVAKE